MNITVTPSVRLRIDLGATVAIGPGKIALLEQIGHSGSLSQAARVLKMSYRRAWLLLDDLNHSLGEPVATTSVGGSGGGGARLTEFGQRLVAAYHAVERGAGELAAQQLGWLADSVAAASARGDLKSDGTGLNMGAAVGMAPGISEGEADDSDRGADARAGVASSARRPINRTLPRAGGVTQTRGRATKRP